ncbi:MAG: Fe-S cluster assembly transcriptional regulator IscR [Gammaproteobacteria bacterium]|nr:Fe-S cluster assembly transcriptional regulator IscR [Gammaproteobacteria bacterium]
MKLTTKGRYAVTAMLDLALNADLGPVSLAEISERQEISLSYLEQLFAKLRKHELVISTRGPGGGYRVARNLATIPVGAIIDAVDESVDATHCGGKKNCHNRGRCLTHDLWAGLSDQIESFLNSVSLQDLIDNRLPGSDAGAAIDPTLDEREEAEAAGTGLSAQRHAQNSALTPVVLQRNSNVSAGG